MTLYVCVHFIVPVCAYLCLSACICLYVSFYGSVSVCLYMSVCVLLWFCLAGAASSSNQLWRWPNSVFNHSNCLPDVTEWKAAFWLARSSLPVCLQVSAVYFLLTSLLCSRPQQPVEIVSPPTTVGGDCVPAHSSQWRLCPRPQQPVEMLCFQSSICDLCVNLFSCNILHAYNKKTKHNILVYVHNGQCFVYFNPLMNIMKTCWNYFMY